MKKLLFILLLCPMMLFISCKDSGSNSSVEQNSNEALINQDIEVSNADFPAKVDFATTIMHVSNDGDCVTYHYEVDESMLDFDAFIANIDHFREEQKVNLVASGATNPDIVTFAGLLNKTGKAMRHEYKGNQTGRVVSFEYSSDELHEMFGDE